MQPPSEAIQIAILVVTLATFVGFGIYFVVFGHQFAWPSGDRLERTTPGGVDVVVIFGPGVSYVNRGEIAGVCTLAIDSCFATWNKYRPTDLAEDSFPIFVVELITGAEMDLRAARWWGSTKEGKPKRRINGYMIELRRKQWGEAAPMAVVRERDKGAIPGTVIHEGIHALLGEFSKVGVGRGHKHPAWQDVGAPAEEMYARRQAAQSRAST